MDPVLRGNTRSRISVPSKKARNRVHRIRGWALAVVLVSAACQPLPPPETGASRPSPSEVPPRPGPAERPAREAGPRGAELRVLLAEGLTEARVSAGGSGGREGGGRRGLTVRPHGSGELEIMTGEGGTSRIAPSPFVLAPPEADGWVAFQDRRYRGSLLVRHDSRGMLTVVNVVGVEEYLRGVVPLEIGRTPADVLAAVKAQAVAARTYALMKRGQFEERGYDLYATVMDQVYRGIEAEWEVADRAIRETEGEVLIHRGELARTYFHSCCGGRTARIEEVWEKPPAPYLRGVDDRPRGASSDEGYCRGSRHFRWQEHWTGEELASTLTRYLPEVVGRPLTVRPDDIRDVRVESRGHSGRVKWLAIRVGSETHRVFGDRVRWVLRPPGGNGAILRSAHFKVDAGRRGGRVAELTLEGGGNGHGVGMCQTGALEMARRGKSHEDILSHYYAGTRLARFSPRTFPVAPRESR